MAALLGVGVSNAWASTTYVGTMYTYDVVFGTPNAATPTDINAQTEFTTDASEQTFTTMSLQISGSCLAGNQANGRTYSFTSAPTTGKVYFKANGHFVGGNYDFFSIKGSVIDNENIENTSYDIVQSPYGLPRNTGATTVLRVFGQDITASSVYTPRDVVYGFDVTIDIENQKVDYVVTYASKGSSGTVSALSTVSGSVPVPDGYTLNSVSSWSIPRCGENAANYYDNVAFYSAVPNVTLYTATFTETNSLNPTIKIYSDAGRTSEVSNGELTDETTYYYRATLDGYLDYDGTFTINGADPDVEFTMTAKAVYSYTVNAKAGDVILEKLAEGSGYKDDKVYYYYKQVINYGGTLYEADAISSAYKTSFDLDSDDKVVNHSYDQPGTPVTNIVFLAEGEDLFTRGTGSAADSRCSMGAGGYASSKTAFVNLGPGKYYIGLSNRCSGERTGIHKFYKGDEAEPFFSADGNGYNAKRYSEEFTLTETTTLYFQGGDNNQYVDWLYIVQTGAANTITSGNATHLTFNNATNGSTYGENWVIDVWNGGSKVAKVRADWWDEVAGTNTGFTYGYTYSSDGGATPDNTNVWGTYVSDMGDADVDLTLSYSEGTLYIIGTMTNGSKVYYVNYAKSGLSGDVSFDVYGNNATLTDVTTAATTVNTTYATPTGVSTTVTGAGYATWVTNNVYSLDFSSTSIEAYKVKVSSKGKATLTKVYQVPAGTPVLLYKEGGATESIPIAIGPVNAIGDNDLVAGTGAAVATTDGEYTNMILNNGEDGIGFYFANDQTVATNRAYLHIATSLAPNAVGGGSRMSMVFADDATGISATLKDNGETTNDTFIYNLNGQRINKPTKGLYIVNGKKAIIK